MIRRLNERDQSDVDLANRIVNDPSVLQLINYTGEPMDWRDALAWCVVLSNGADALGAFEQSGERIWQTHTVFLPSCRGRKALDTAAQMIEFMKPWADCIWGATPMNNPAARWFNRKMGCTIFGNDVYEAEGPVELFKLELN